MRIAAPAWREMVAHAEAAYPEESCGALLGNRDAGGWVVHQAVRLLNAHPNRRTRYQVAPEDLLAATRTARAQGQELLAIYHSHPDRDAHFSPTDLEQACPWYCYVVLAVRQGRFEGARAWKPRPDLSAADPEPLQPPPADR